jgi:hypothetical protein
MPSSIRVLSFDPLLLLGFLMVVEWGIHQFALRLRCNFWPCPMCSNWDTIRILWGSFLFGIRCPNSEYYHYHTHYQSRGFCYVISFELIITGRSCVSLTSFNNKSSSSRRESSKTDFPIMDITCCLNRFSTSTRPRSRDEAVLHSWSRVPSPFVCHLVSSSEALGKIARHWLFKLPGMRVVTIIEILNFSWVCVMDYYVHTHDVFHYHVVILSSSLLSSSSLLPASGDQIQNITILVIPEDFNLW